MSRGKYLSYGVASARIKAGKIARLYLLWGDDYLCGRVKRLLRETLFRGAGEEFDLSRVDATAYGPGELLGLVRTAPFLASRRLVIAERVRAFKPAPSGGATSAPGAASGSDQAASIEPGPTAGADAGPGNRAPPSAGPPAETGGQGAPQGGKPGEGWERLITGIPETSCLVLSLEGPPDARLRLTKLAGAHGEAVDCDTAGRAGATLAGQALRERAEQLGCRLGWRERSLLLNTVGADCGRLVAELEKIAIYCDGRPPSEQDILLLSARTAEGDIWQLLDAVDGRRADLAVRIVRAALAGGESPVALVASLASQVRMMARTREQVAAGVKPEELAAALGANRYWVEQSFRRARGFSLAALYDAVCELADLDLAIKTGAVDGAVGVEYFVLGLCAARAVTANGPAGGTGDNKDAGSARAFR